MTLPFGLTWEVVNPALAALAVAIVGYEAARALAPRLRSAGPRDLRVDPGQAWATNEDLHRRRAERLAEENGPVVLAAALLLAEERERARAADPITRGKSLVERLREVAPPGPITAAPTLDPRP